MIEVKSPSQLSEVYSSWERVQTQNGVRYLCPVELGTGYADVIGEIETAFVFISHYTQYHDTVYRSNTTERLISIADVQESQAKYYLKRAEAKGFEAGVNCGVNAMPTFVYSRIAANTPVYSTGIVIRQSFLEQHINFDFCSLEKMAHCLNNKTLYSGSILAVCKQLRSVSVEKNLIPSYIEAKAKELVTLLMQLTIEAGDERALSTLHFDRIKQAKAFLDEQYATSITVDQLCTKFFLNKNLLQAGFKSLTGHTIHEYVTYQRVYKSLDLLLETDTPITQIARKVGFRGKANYYRAFKKFFQTTPQEFRCQFSACEPDWLEVQR